MKRKWWVRGNCGGLEIDYGTFFSKLRKVGEDMGMGGLVLSATWKFDRSHGVVEGVTAVIKESVYR